MKLKLLLLFCCCALLSACNGQQANKSLSAMLSTSVIGDTVSTMSNSIWIVFQATNGHYWFGSDLDGVYRFDGKTTINYTIKDGLNSNRIRSIQEDKQGNIYIATLEGINKFNGHSFTSLTATQNIVMDNNWKLQSNDLWFCTPGKNGQSYPYRYDGTTLYQLNFPKNDMADEYFAKFPNNAWSPYDVYYIYKDRNGYIWFGTSNLGLCRYDGNSFCWLYEDHLTNTPEGGSFGIRSIIEDTTGKYWFCNTQYCYNILPDSIHAQGSRLIKYTKEKGIDGIKTTAGSHYIYFMSAINDNEGNLWLATYNQGVWKYDGKKATHYSVIDGTNNILLFSIYKDLQGNIWLGTHEKGAYRFNGTVFEKFKF